MQKLEVELESLRQDREDLREQLKGRDQLIEGLQARWADREQQWADREQQWADREQQWADREQQWAEYKQQWADREQQWEQQREGLSQQVNQLESKVADLGLQLKIAQKIVPSSEKGKPLTKPSAIITSTSGGGNGGESGGGANSKGLPEGGAPSIQKEKYLGIFERLRAHDPSVGFPSKQAYWESVGSDTQLIPAPATIFGSQIFARAYEDKNSSFTAEERRSLFGREKGLHSKKDETTLYDLRLALVEITCTQQNLRELAGGVYCRKGHALGPASCQMSWETLAQVSTLVAEYAFPMERLAKAVGHPYFSSANISRWFIRSATALVNVYIALGKALAARPYLRMDDTSGLVLALREEARAGLVSDKEMSGEEWEAYLDALRKNKRKAALIVPIIEAFGRVAQRADEKGAKTSVNVTLISGLLIASDYRSTAYFYRTHFGQAGNLLSRMLEHRKAQASAVIIVQGDLSAQNHLEAEIAKLFKVTYIGCTSHARRPIFRYKDRDEQLCFYLLRCFAVLASIEDAIKRGPLTHERILRYRQRYATKVWARIQSICQAVVDEVPHPITGKPRWRKDDKLYDACLYVIRHFPALTHYLSDPRLEPDNNAIEQGLRGEKLIKNASHFRKSELGRIALDIHRTFIATCNACGLAYRDFLHDVMTADPDDVAAHPERYFPHEVAAARIRDPPKKAIHPD